MDWSRSLETKYPKKPRSENRPPDDFSASMGYEKTGFQDPKQEKEKHERMSFPITNLY